jgi:hypothetical protein
MDKYIAGATLKVQLTITGEDLTDVVNEELRYRSAGGKICSMENATLDGQVIAGSFIPEVPGKYHFWFYGELDDGTIYKSNLVEVIVSQEGL